MCSLYILYNYDMLWIKYLLDFMLKFGSRLFQTLWYLVPESRVCTHILGWNHITWRHVQKTYVFLYVKILELLFNTFEMCFWLKLDYVKVILSTLVVFLNKWSQWFWNLYASDLHIPEIHILIRKEKVKQYKVCHFSKSRIFSLRKK